MVSAVNRVWLLFWMAAAFMLAACADSDPGPTATTAPTATAAPTATVEATATVAEVPLGDPPVIPAALRSTTPGFRPIYTGLYSLEYNILAADVIARVTLASVATSTAQDTVGYDDLPRWRAMLEFQFTVTEYLKGSGGNRISGLVATGMRYQTEAEAQEAAALLPNAHDSRWDNREAVVFLASSHYWSPEFFQPAAGQYWFGPMFRHTSNAGQNDAYTVASIHSKLWLPERTASGVQGQSASDKTFLLDVPAVLGASRSTSQSRSYTPDPPPASEITLSSLKSKIAALEAEANAGGTDAYYVCITATYGYMNALRHSRLRNGGRVPQVVSSSAIASGQPEGTFVYEFQPDSAPSRDLAPQMAWFEGTNSDLLRFDIVNLRAGGRYGWQFGRNIVTTRPLPAGSYRLYPLNTAYQGVACKGTYPELGRNIFIHDLTVTAPGDTLHEAFFDPVDIGSAVGADGTNGVLKPAAFTVGGASATISSLKWESGTATMVLSPSASLAGYAVDFIALDGSVTSTLAFDDATRSGGTLTWSAATQPWNAGDKLMLRVYPRLLR